MTKKSKINPVITNALVWAALMIATSLILGDLLDSGKSQLILMLQVAGWFATNGLVEQKARSCRPN